MLRAGVSQPRRVLLTLDAVGGIWRHTLDLARGLALRGIQCLLVGAGPPPSAQAAAEATALSGIELAWTGQPLDWLARSEAELAALDAELGRLARHWGADLLHLSLPSQAAALPCDQPVVVTSHSCTATWWEAVRGCALPEELRWQVRRNRHGFGRAGIVLVPTAAHGAALRRVYGVALRVRQVANATRLRRLHEPKEAFVLAAGRWWDEGKNGRTLDQAAARIAWPVVMAGALAGPDGTAIEIRHALAMGEVRAEAMLAMMDRAGIFVSTALYEPFGLAVLEAAASGAALVLADIPTFRELWDGAAVFVAGDDPVGFACAINALTVDEPRRGRLAAEGRRRAASYTVGQQVEAVLRAYAELLPRAAARAAAEA